MAGGALALAGYAVGRRHGEELARRDSAPRAVAVGSRPPALASAGVRPGTGLGPEAPSPGNKARDEGALATLARLDPARAMGLALQQRNRRRRADWLHSALRGWARVDPAAAAAAAAQLPAADQEEAEAAVMDGAAEHPEAAISLTLALMQADPDARRSDANHLLSALSQAGAYGQAIRFVSALPPDLQPEMLATAYQSWAQAEPENAFADAARQPPGDARTTAVEAALSGWSQVDPAGLADYAIGLPAGGERAQALELALGEWVQLDPPAAAAWLNGAAAQPEFDPGIAAIAARPQFIARQPDTAANWAEHIADPALRSRTLASVLQDWASANPDAARRYALSSGGLQPADRTALLALMDSGTSSP